MYCLNIVPFLCFFSLYVAPGFKFWGSCCLYPIIGFTFLVHVVMLPLSHKKICSTHLYPFKDSCLIVLVVFVCA